MSRANGGIIGKDLRQVRSNPQIFLLTSSGGITFTSNPILLSNGGTLQYKYHVFLSSSSFVSSGNGLVDILCVGGGGGGGSGESGNTSGNAGSGGNVVTVVSRTVSATTYAVTVGGGGATATAGTTSSVTGITGATATGGALGLNAASGGNYLAGNGAGGNRGAVATATSAQTPGIGIGVDFFNSVDLSLPEMSRWRLDAVSGLVYFGSGGVSGWFDSGNGGANRGNAALGGGSGLITSSIFGDVGLAGLNRTAVPNTGGGGAAGLRWLTQVTAGQPGGSGFVAIRYRI